MFFALFAYLRVLRPSSSFTSAGDTQAIIIVRELPPRESCNSLNESPTRPKRHRNSNLDKKQDAKKKRSSEAYLVILLSRKGTWPPLRFSSARALMQLPRAEISKQTSLVSESITGTQTASCLSQCLQKHTACLASIPSRPALMLMPSCALSPVAPVLFSLSEPDRDKGVYEKKHTTMVRYTRAYQQGPRNETCSSLRRWWR